MSNSTPPGAPARSGGLSLYANLLDPSSASANTSASISRGPVVFNRTSNETTQSEEAAAKKQQIDAAALRFQPTKRPQLASQKPKPKPKFPKAADAKIAPVQQAPKSAVSQTAARPVKNTLADWTIADDDDVNGFYGGGEKRQRGGRKRRKKNKDDYAAFQDWDDIYDPSRPNNYEEYKNSDEKIREVREWKDRLYAHRIARKHSSDLDSDDEAPRRRVNNQFAPPPNFSFAPPPIPNPVTTEASTLDSTSALHPPSQSLPTEQSPTPPPPPPSETLPAGAISRAPVRYNLPAAPTEIPTSEAELERALQEEHTYEDENEDQEADSLTRSRAPGQKGFAERLMSKYGWSKGTGLGASGDGIINPLQVKVEKRKKKSDAEGGGFRDGGGRGKIIGGKRAKRDEEEEGDAGGRFGGMSDVIVLRGMVDGMDLDEEVVGSGGGDGGLMQEIGDECGEKYGRVERVYIDRHGAAPAKVFVKFTSQLSALRAVNALEGRIFNGNTISALFYDSEKFEGGIYE